MTQRLLPLVKDDQYLASIGYQAIGMNLFLRNDIKTDKNIISPLSALLVFGMEF